MSDESFHDAQPAPPRRGIIDSVSDGAGAGPDLRKARKARRQRADNNGQFQIDRLPPHSPEAEQGVLGCVLLSPNDCLPQVIELISSNSDVFYDLRHQTIFDAMMGMFALKAPIDILTLQQWLKDDKLLDEVGGIPYLNALQDVAPSSANLSYYVGIVLEKYLLRRYVQTCTELVGRVYEHEGDAKELADTIERDILAIRAATSKTTGSSGMKELVPQSLAMIEDYFNRQGTIGGLATGFADYDRLTDGLHQGEMIVLAARPSMGKTSLMCNIMEYVALNTKLPVGIFSLEMTKQSLTTRILTSRARVNLRNIREGFMSEADFPKLTSAAGKMTAALIQIDDTPGLTIMELRARARRMVQQFGIKVLGVDYLQLLHGSSKRAKDNRQQEITEISEGVKSLAKELNLPVIILSQLNRDLERDKKRKPKLSDLRESGAIEQDADVVGLLYKPQFDDEEAAEEADGVMVNLDIAKQRSGPTGTINLTFLKPFTRFESAARVSDEDVPQESMK